MRNLTLVFLLTFSIFPTIIAQEINFGVQAGVQLNSAILPNLKLNTMTNIYHGEDVVQGEAQYADINTNYRFGGFVQLEDGFGFSSLEADYSTTHIYKEISYQSGLFGNLSTKLIDRKYDYLDFGLSYNVFLDKNHRVYFGLGGGPALLVHYTGSEEPTKTNWSVFSHIGISVNQFQFQLKPQLGITEVYKDSYIHHLLLPISVGYVF